MTDEKAALLGDKEAAKLTHLSLFSGIGGLDLKPLDNASGRTIRQRCWKNTGQMCHAGGTSGR